jgi:hypothetical protein
MTTKAPATTRATTTSTSTATTTIIKRNERKKGFREIPLNEGFSLQSCRYLPFQA